MLKKHEDYFSRTKWDINELVRDGDNIILEIGCGEGNSGKNLKEQGKAVEVVGVEKVPEIAEIAKTKIDKVICADVEFLKLPFSKEYFDYVIIGDVLEHLYDPWMVVSELRQYLKRGGYIIASIPNIRNWRIIRDLVLKGEWEYCSEGLLDDTHLRFFTKKSMMRLFESKDFEVNRIIPRFKFRPTSKSNILNNFTLGLLEGFLARQYLIEAKKP